MNLIKSIQNKIKGLQSARRVIGRSNYDRKKLLLEWSIVNSREMGITQERYCNHEIIVSLTTYGKRIYDVALTIESIMQQTMKSNRIILWLDYSFENRPLPANLRLLQKRGLEIAFCKDIRSYKKLIPTLKAYPESAVITVDDDILYEYDFLEHLINAYVQEPQHIYCHRCHRIAKDMNDNILPYNSWLRNRNFEEEQVPNHRLFFTGVGGVLYPPYSLDNEVFNESVFMDICKFADDVWFNAMALKKGTKTKMVFSHHKGGDDFLINEEVQDIGLRKINTENDCLNDKQIKDVFTKYDLYKLI